MSLQLYDTIKKENNEFKSVEGRLALLTEEMTLACIFALYDPLRDEIVESVKQCHNAGINIRMVTGDSVETAKAIAIQAGIVNPKDVDKEFVCMTGE